MKALVKTKRGVGNVKIMDVEEPKAGPHQVVIEVKAAGLCGTDYHIYHDEYKSKPPVILGHEIAGVIAEAGPGVNGLEPGDRVTTETYFETCGDCPMCRGGKPNLCPERMSIGSMTNGGMTKYLLVPAGNIHLLPENVDFKAGSLTEPLACVIHSLMDMSDIRASDVVVVSGPGPIGLLACQVARQCGAYTVVVGIGDDRGRLELSKELGADRTIVADEEDTWGIIAGLTDGNGADVVCECAGAEASVRSCLNLVRRAGQYVQIGLAGQPIKFDIDQIIFKEIPIRGGFATIPSSWKRALRMMELGQVKTAPLVSHTLPISDWEKAFEIFNQKTGLKIVLTPVD